MELQFLGTSSGTPTKTRNVSGTALRTAGGWVLVDCGEGTQHRILHTSLSPHDLRAVFVTHLHGDHCYGLPGLLASAGLLNRTAPLAIVGPPPLERYVRGVIDTTGLELPYPVAFIDVADAAGAGILDDLAVTVAALSHRVPSFSYGFTEKVVERRLDAARLAAAGVPRGPLWGALQAGEDVTLPDGRAVRSADVLQPPRRPRRIVIAGDNDNPGLLAEQVRGADVLVHEATYTEAILAKVGPGPQHSSALRVARFAHEAAIPNLLLTHFSPRYGDGAGGQGGTRRAALALADVEAEARTQYGGKLFLARDLARYALDKAGMLTELPPR
jgi:ribonuclease Z